MSKEYSKSPAFTRIPNTGVPVYEMIFRVMANAPDGSVKSSGTCSLIAGNLVITAKHVVEDFLTLYGIRQEGDNIEANFTIWVIQITNEESPYAVWAVEEMWFSPNSDMALLRISPYDENAAKIKNRKQFPIALLPPPPGSRVFGVGFHSTADSSSVTFGEDGTRHIVVNDEPYVAVGEVVEIYHEKRDNVMINFPAYRVNFKSEGGMSGGPVFNNDGKLCGIISAGWKVEDTQTGHMSIIATLWPLLGMYISADRGDKYPRGIVYPVIELAKDNIISASGWENVVLDPTTFKVKITNVS